MVPDQYITTENVYREWDAEGKLTREISTLTQTRTPQDPVKPAFGFQALTSTEPTRTTDDG
jgi:hypothetical protein